MKKISSIVCVILFCIVAYAQQNIGLGGQPDASAKLDVQSNSSGFLMPRLTVAERDLIVSPAEGLMIYNLTSKCLNIWNSSSWIEVCHNPDCSSLAGTISVDADNVACGSNVTLSLANYNGNIQWNESQDGGSYSPIAGSTSTEVVSIGYATSYFKVYVVDPGCGGRWSDPVLVTTIPPVAGTAHAGASSATCGSNVGLTVTGYTPGGTSIQWQISPSGNDGSYTDIPGGTGDNISAPISYATNYYRATVTDACSAAAYSSTVSVTSTFTVMPGAAGADYITIPSCAGTEVTFTLTGSSGNIQWQSSTDSITFTDIPDATTSPSTVLVNGTTYVRAAVSDPCGSSSTQYSNTVTITATSSVTAGAAGSDISNTTSCSPVTANLTLSGYTGNIQWQISLDNINFYDIPGANAASYAAPVIGATYFRAAVSDCSGGNTVYSNTITITSTASDCQRIVAVLVVGGGGGGGEGTTGGGGGAGGFRYYSGYTVTQQAYAVTVGDGGATDNPGGNSIFDNITAAGGGAGGTYGNPDGNPGYDGGSGGGGGYAEGGALGAGGNGNVPATIPAQGNAGSVGGEQTGNGGGGGAGAAGGEGGVLTNGGDGLPCSITGSAVYYAGGGGGGTERVVPAGIGGLGGGGNGADRIVTYAAATAGTPNTGGGGGGSFNLYHNSAAPGGSGVVIISYPTGSMTSTGGSQTTAGSNTVVTFNAGDTWTPSW